MRFVLEDRAELITNPTIRCNVVGVGIEPLGIRGRSTQIAGVEVIHRERLSLVGVIAYVIGRNFGLDPSNSAFYIDAWEDEGAEMIQDQLDRISATAERVIGVRIA
ncbi:MAG: hypothetical protein ABEH59_12325 [Halobacteriales archaeon]